MGEEYEFWAVGFGELDLDALVKENGLDDRFVIFPKLGSNQIRALMSRADLFCLPSKFTPEEGSEGIPVVLMEAMSMGLPVVATHDGSIDELVPAACLAKPGDSDELAHLIHLKTSTCNASEASDNRRAVTTCHSTENFDRLVDYFEHVAKYGRT